MDTGSRAPASLVLLIDTDPVTRGVTRALALQFGLDIVQSRTSTTALELLQRVPERFRLAIVSLEMPDVPGVVVMETLRLFRPGLVALCLTGDERYADPAVPGGCLPKPVRPDRLRTRIAEALAGHLRSQPVVPISPEAAARATAAFGATGSLLDAARELARGMPRETGRE